MGSGREIYREFRAQKGFKNSRDPAEESSAIADCFSGRSSGSPLAFKGAKEERSGWKISDSLKSRRCFRHRQGLANGKPSKREVDKVFFPKETP
jgi:hypothetical protein